VTQNIDGERTVRTPRLRKELRFRTRSDTNDGALVTGIITYDEYHLRDLRELHGTAIDIGAHVGAVTLSLLADHPDLHVIAVEVVPENVEVLRINIEENGFSDRTTIIQAAAAEPGRKTASVLWNYRSAGSEPEAYVKDSRFIAGIYGPKQSDADSHRVKAVALDDLMAGLDKIDLLKIDCEGCEWQFLRSPRVKDVERIVGEFHNEGGIETLRGLIGDTHQVMQFGGQHDIGLFRAVLTSLVRR